MIIDFFLMIYAPKPHYMVNFMVIITMRAEIMSGKYITEINSQKLKKGFYFKKLMNFK
ncbi:hypothetical protein PROPEN_04531 [Proteus penneri ATCC 35198]|nr:hypothetical protein PROPEN_04531 [Proteus penneri ATCC 35198]